MTRFSVIIPTYNRAEDLKRCLNALYDQTIKTFEVIVCDDGSTDHTTKIVDQFIDKLDIQYLFSENWGGPAAPRNAGVRIAKGEWVCFLDSDDWWFPTKLEENSKYLNQADFIFHNVKNYIGIKPLKTSVLRSIILFFRSPKNILRNGNFIACSSVCIRKKLMQGDLFPEDKSIIALEDYYAWLSLFQREKIRIKHIGTELSAYSISFDNISQYNRKYLSRLFSFKRKLKRELNLEVKSSCLNYLIGVNLLHLKMKSRANLFFTHSLINSKSVSIKLKSLIRIIR